LEACALGTPIITTTASDALDWIQEFVGLVVEPNELALAHGIWEVISNRNKRNLFASNGPVLVQRKFSWDTVLARYLAVYDECLETAELWRSRAP
jgi:glycosyltransferase involved in cell wall biosynthesis